VSKVKADKKVSRVRHIDPNFMNITDRIHFEQELRIMVVKKQVSYNLELHLLLRKAIAEDSSITIATAIRELVGANEVLVVNIAIRVTDS
jgi:hypothetical protein